MSRTTSAALLLAGPLAPALLYLAGWPGDMDATARLALGVTFWMGLWWVTDVVPMAITALVPTLAFPLLGILGARETAEAYAHPMVFLFLGGFLVARAMEVVRLHERIALWVVLKLGGSPTRVLLGFMAATAVLSAWMSNTATCVMMMPLALGTASFLGRTTDGHSAALPLLLGVAYSASIGGLTTILGTPTNGILASITADRYGVELGFAEWLKYGGPVAVVLVLITYAYLARVSGLGGRDAGETLAVVRERYGRLGRMSPDEKKVAAVFGAMALAWSTRALYDDLVPVTDPGIAVLGAGLVFALPGGRPGGRLLDWVEGVRIPWGVLLLFAGGLALARGFSRSGLAEYMGGKLAAITTLPGWAVTGVVVAFVNFLTEVTSNVATASVVLPILASLADQTGLDPMQLMAGATLAASCAFMLPMATGPNAVVFASGELTVAYMAKRGVALNVISIVVVTAWMWVVG